MPLPNLIGFAGWARVGKSTCARSLEGVGGVPFHQIGFADAVREALVILDPVVEYEARLPDGSVIAGSYFCKLSEVLAQGAKFDPTGGWEFGKFFTPGVRGLMQRMGDELGRGFIDPGLWARKLFEVADPWVAAGHRVVVADVRYPNEVEAIRQRGGVTVWVESERVPRPPFQHASELSLKAEDCDCTFRNDGPISELRAHLVHLLNSSEVARVNVG